ncbi:MAG: peptidylprolyl isomerase [Candidatus Omnitrophica bacterium]|nr:peptidylprolyl isomerase [Candidatus Omnitrophota bacterium]
MRTFLRRFNTLAVAAGILMTAGCSKPAEEPESKQTTEKVEVSAEREAPVQEAMIATDSPMVAEVGPLKFYLDDVLKLTRENEDQILPVGPESEKLERLKANRKETLKRMIDRRLLILGAAKHPEWVNDASWEEQVQTLYAKMGAEEIERRRKAAGVGKEEFMEQFRKFIREEMMIRELVAREVESATPPSEEELMAAYEKERDTTFTRPESWAVYHVDRYLPRAEADSLPKVVEELERIRAEVAASISSATTPKAKANLMAPFVKEHSEAPDAQVGYAYIYDTTKVNFDPELVDHVRTATMGELSPVFELAGDEEKVGATFFLVFENRPGDTVSFETAKRVLIQKMMEERKRENRDRLFEELEAQFPVEVKEEALYVGLEDAPNSAESP